MSPDEALKLCRLAKAASPAQAVDEYTPELWSLVLADVRFVDAQQALVDLAAEQEWIHVSHIVKRVKRIRGQRIRDYGRLPDPPPGLSDAEETRWLAETSRRIADGEQIEAPQLENASPPDPAHQKHLRNLLSGAFQAMPDE